jgi:hypothetical protein
MDLDLGISSLSSSGRKYYSNLLYNSFYSFYVIKEPQVQEILVLPDDNVSPISLLVCKCSISLLSAITWTTEVTRGLG